VKKRKHDKTLFVGVAAEPHHDPERGEPVHKGLARGALHKAAQQYREGEIDPAEMDAHIARAHNRLTDMMPIPMPPPSHRKRKK
jgi:hypothetical protein